MLKLSAQNFKNFDYFTRSQLWKIRQQCCFLKMATTTTSRWPMSRDKTLSACVYEKSVKFSTSELQNGKINNENVLDFGNSEIAFKPKRTPEILRALFVYKLCSSNAIINNNRRVSLWLYKFTIYKGGPEGVSKYMQESNYKSSMTLLCENVLYKSTLLRVL